MVKSVCLAIISILMDRQKNYLISFRLKNLSTIFIFSIRSFTSKELLSSRSISPWEWPWLMCPCSFSVFSLGSFKLISLSLNLILINLHGWRLLSLVVKFIMHKTKNESQINFIRCRKLFDNVLMLNNCKKLCLKYFF